MTNKQTFNEVKAQSMKTLKQYVPVVARVHGKNHPEFYEVQELFDVLEEKTREAGSKVPELQEEFAKLRARRGHAAALEEAMADISGLADEWLTRRLSDAAAAIDVTRPKEQEDLREVDVAPNGLAIDREERDMLDRLMGEIEYRRKGGR